MNAKLAALGKSLFALAIVAALASIASPAQAATLTVNTTDDRDDGSCNASHCSLREAIQAANNHVGPDTISFAIPGPGPHIIAIEGRPPASEHAPPGFWLLNDGTVIDGTTQPGYTGVPMIVLDGSRSLYSYAGGTLSESLNIVSSDSTVRGLSFVGFPIEAIGIEYPSGGGNLIEGNYIGLNPAGLAQGNEVGIVISWDVGPNTIRNNVISGNRDGIRVLGDGQIIQGNLIGLDPTGSAARENVVGIHLSGGSNWVGGLSAGQGNTISGNAQTGLWINSFNNVVAGNRIGTNAAATAAIPNGVGILVDRDASANDIGLDLPGSENVISGNVTGIRVRGERTSIVGNRIGTDASGLAAVPNQTGIILLGTLNEVEDNWIGFNTTHGIWVAGTDMASLYTNTIYHNGQDGIRLGDAESGSALSTSGVMIRRNTLFENGGLGIRFDTPGVNGGIVAPVLTYVTRTAAVGTVCPSCRVELFISDHDPSGFGEGKDLVASVLASADGAFSATYPEALTYCHSITATATDNDRNTSEFAQNVDAGLCVRIPPLWLVPLFLIPASGGSALLVVITRLLIPRRRLGWDTLGWGFLGALFGTGLVLLVLALPMVEIQRSVSPAGEQPLPSTAAPQLEGPPPTETEVISPPPGEPSPTPTVEPSATPTPTATPQEPPEATFLQNANCREGPALVYDIVTSLHQGQTARVDGRSVEGSWWWILLPGLQAHCWVAGSTVQVSGDIAGVTVYEAPPEPVPACWVFDPQQQQNVCTMPCPSNAQPGGTCTP